jgi:hypothetical protein
LLKRLGGKEGRRVKVEVDLRSLLVNVVRDVVVSVV